MRTHPQRGALASATLATASCIVITALVSGCSGPATTTTNSPTSAASANPSGSSPGSNGSAAAAGDSGSAVADLGQPAATRQATVRGYQVALDVYPLRKTDAYVTLNARLRVVKAKVTTEVDVAPASLLSTNVNSVLEDNPEGISLVDPAAKLRYRPAVGADKSVLCGPTIPSHWETGDQIIVSCIFGAPSSNSVTVDAVIFGSIPNVPVQ